MSAPRTVPVLDDSRTRMGTERHTGHSALVERNKVYDAEEALYAALEALRETLPPGSREKSVLGLQIADLHILIDRQRRERAFAFTEAAAERQ